MFRKTGINTVTRVLPFDFETGEIFDLEVVREHYKVMESVKNKNVFDVSLIGSNEDLVTYNVELYGFHYSGSSNRGKVESLVISCGLSFSEVKVLVYLINRVAHHNYVVLSMVDILGKLEIKKTMIYDTLEKLKNKKYIRVVLGNNKVKKGYVLLQLYPTLQWRGYDVLIAQELNTWFKKEQ